MAYDNRWMVRPEWLRPYMPDAHGALVQRAMSARTHELHELKGPDFLCIGAPRSGTSWLYEVLSRHPALWLPPIKELHYFDEPSGSKRYYSYLRMRLTSGLWMNRPFSRFDLPYFFGRRDDAWYCRSVRARAPPGLITGEITPAYSTLEESDLVHLRRLNPKSS